MTVPFTRLCRHVLLRWVLAFAAFLAVPSVAQPGPLNAAPERDSRARVVQPVAAPAPADEYGLASTQAVTPTLPVVFIPGISGTSIVSGTDAANRTTLWPSIFNSPAILATSLYPSANPNPNIGPASVITLALGIEKVYEPVFDSFNQAGYPTYETGGLVSRQTSAGCDLSQRPNGPLFFPFAYDWRKDNAQSAAELKDYIGCIQQFYPGAKVNIVTHSMGGLVARRYLLDTSPANNVNALLTIAAPWLGAPKMSYVLQTGDFSFVIPKQSLQQVIGSYTAANQLLSSSYYLSATASTTFTSPIKLNGYCYPGITNCYQSLDYPTYVSALNAAYGKEGFLPGTAQQNFYGYSVGNPQNGQADSRLDQSGVTQYSFFGIQHQLQTIGQMTLSCSNVQTCTTNPNVQVSMTYGDGTVPWLSALRWTGHLSGTQEVAAAPDYNPPSATIVPFISPSTGQDDNYSHTGLVSSNPTLLKCMVETIQGGALGASCPAPLGPATQPFNPAGPQGTSQSRYLTVRGAQGVILIDQNGETTALNGDGPGLKGTVPGVDEYLLGPDATLFVLPPTGVFTVTFAANQPAAPLSLELRTGTGDATTAATRYLDVQLPPNAQAMMQLDPNGANALFYDPPGGPAAFDVLVPPTYGAQGATAADITPPRVSIAAERSGAATTVRITANDSGVGVDRIWYSFDGVQFARYTGPLTLPATQGVVYAYADDGVGNRSSMVAQRVAELAFIPRAARNEAG